MIVPATIAAGTTIAITIVTAIAIEATGMITRTGATATTDRSAGKRLAR